MTRFKKYQIITEIEFILGIRMVDGGSICCSINRMPGTILMISLFPE